MLRALGAVLQGADLQPLRRTLSLWARLLLRRKVPKVNIAGIDGIHHLLEAQERLAGASEPQLVNWTAAILTAISLQHLFGTDGLAH
ncbi:MAG: hypothetical protein IPN53_21090 [Comamonadaceae bacterium]|nr:hypothetical protein [Comamonadaceae bacterium]